MSAGVLGRPSRVGRDAAAVVLVTRAGAEVARWPLRLRDGADLSVVDELARLQLAARRLGCSIRVSDACDELRGLLELVGLDVVLEVVGETEGGEEGRIAVDDEVVERGDPIP